MKSKPTPILSVLRLALALVLLPALHAQQETPPVAPALATPEPAAAPAKTVEAGKSAPAAETPAPVAAPAAAEAQPAVAAAPAADDAKKIEEKSAEPEKPATPEKPAKKVRVIGHNSRAQHSGNERVSIFHDSSLAAGEKSGAVVSIIGSSTSAGDVDDVVLSVLGSSTSSGNVGNGVVSIVGNTRVNSGTVGDAAVAVLGNNYVNGHVGTVVAVLGNVELGPDAVVDGEIVCVGGEVKRDAKAVVHGNVQNIALGGHHFNFEGLQTWFSECLLYGRPLAFNSHLTWAWCIALVFLGFYALLALVTPAGVLKCVTTLEERPGYSLLSALLTLLLTPVAYLLLVVTIFIGIGIVLIPLFSLGLFFATLFGKVVLLAWLGRRITKFFGDGPLSHPVFGVLIGGGIVLLLYTVPVLGFVLYYLMKILGLGVVVYTLLRMFKASRSAPRPVAVAAGFAGGGMVGESGPPPTLLPPVISAATLMRAGFWIRFLASALDFALFVIVCIFLKGLWHGFPLWLALYCTVMWATKGTTIGGIICGLKVVRLDDRPVDWGVALIRAFSGFLSLFVAGLGFIWVAFDNEKQSWHDKIAGTTIVRVPRGTPLL
jgi:uncharacterized RDD family membrane protein YckC